MTYDFAGRPQTFYHPRRDDAYRTITTNTYQRGWLTSAQVTLTDPFNPNSPTAVTAAFSYAPSGNQSQVVVTTGTGTAYTLRTPDQGSVPRIGGWQFDRGAGIASEYRTYTYDGSSNLVLTNTSSFAYDARSRLTKFVEGSTQYRNFDSFGNTWSIDDSVTGVQTFTPELTTNRHVATGSGIPAAYDANRGTLLFDSLQSRNVGRDYYSDGRPMAEYLRTSSSYSALQPAGLGLYLEDARGERALTFQGTDGQCQTELFRQTIRDESGRILTDYKADNNGQCNCGNPSCQWYDRFERDYVFLGSYTLVTLKRGETPHYTVLDHLGSPRHQVDATGTLIGIDVLDAWGLQVAVNIPERTRFTGHERNHVDLDGTSLPISDYMHTRTYVPMLGRFTSPDIKRSFSHFNPGNMNRYMYANANPAKYVDLFGLSSDSPDNPQDPKMPGVETGEDVIGQPIFDPSGTNRFLWDSFMQTAQLTKPTGTFVRSVASAAFPGGGVAVGAYESDMTWGEVGLNSLHGFEAFWDGVIPFCDPLASLGWYDANGLGMKGSRIVGEVTRDVELSIALSASKTIFGQGRWLNRGPNRIGHSKNWKTGWEVFSLRGKWVDAFKGRPNAHIDLLNLRRFSR